MDLLLAVLILSAFVLVPGLLNSYANRSAAGGRIDEPGRWELAVAGWVTSFVALTVAAMVVLAIALVYDDLRQQIADFARLGLRAYAEDRPFALSGVLTLVALTNMALMTLLGAMRIPGRLLR
jgi:hypothetical protein